LLIFAVSGLRYPVSGFAQCPDGSPPPCRAARTTQAAAATANSVAVLYFDNLSRDTADAYLADGLSEELIVRLSQVHRLDVKSRFESQRVRGRAAGDPRALGRSLRAAYLVTGSMQQAGQQVRLRVSLVRTADGSNVWGDVYDRSGGNILQIQSDIAREVAGAITGQLLPAERATLTRRPTADPTAYQLYVRAVGAANTLTESALRSALELLGSAIARDSSFAEAWAEQAFVWSWLADGYITGREGFEQTRASAQRAVDLDSTNTLALSVLSLAVMALDRDALHAEAFARRSIAVDPRQAYAYTSLSNVFLWTGRTAEYVDANRRAFENDTVAAVGAILYMDALLLTEDVATLRRVLPRTILAIDAASFRDYDGVLQLAGGNAAGAVERIDWRHYGGAKANIRARALMTLHRAGEARAMADSMVALATHGYFNPYGIAETFAEIGDADQAFAWLGRALDERTVWFLSVKQDHAFTAMHDDPRWAALMRRAEGL
jgi:TolB-like protein